MGRGAEGALRTSGASMQVIIGYSRGTFVLGGVVGLFAVYWYTGAVVVYDIGGRPSGLLKTGLWSWRVR